MQTWRRCAIKCLPSSQDQVSWVWRATICGAGLRKPWIRPSRYEKRTRRVREGEVISVELQDMFDGLRTVAALNAGGGDGSCGM